MSDRRQEAIALARVAAAKAELRAVLLAQPASVRGCSVDECPGPRASERGGCPMGYSGSCQGHH